MMEFSEAVEAMVTIARLSLSNPSPGLSDCRFLLAVCEGTQGRTSIYLALNLFFGEVADYRDTPNLILVGLHRPDHGEHQDE